MIYDEPVGDFKFPTNSVEFIKNDTLELKDKIEKLEKENMILAVCVRRVINQCTLKRQYDQIKDMCERYLKELKK